MTAEASARGVSVVLVTAPDREGAEALAERLVRERAAACVNVLGGVTSIYRWEGVVERATEALLVIKTASEHADALVERIEALHPYDVPEALVLPVGSGLPSYLRWVVESSGGEPEARVEKPGEGVPGEGAEE